MIRRSKEGETGVIAEVINDGASAYKGVIPADRWHEPYMPRDYLDAEIVDGVKFWVMEDGGQVVGVMGIQDVKDVTLIRHAYVRTAVRRGGIGSALLGFLQDQTERPLLIGTWADAVWAVDFYRKHGFQLIEGADKDALLDAYWTIPDRQRDTSVVLADARWNARGT
jgi:N-acetylglutamate synthase-like GNAT family acetyltransferase|tara:strand:+ start:157 stop:657 length:501 start_codon:yes stop_codon:yes gene_type:complete